MVARASVVASVVARQQLPRLNPQGETHSDFHSLPFGEGYYKPDKIEDFMIETAVLLLSLWLSVKVVDFAERQKK